MSTYDVIKMLCDKKGIAVTALEKELHFGRGSIGKMRTGEPSALRLQKIADYFGVSIDFLMTGEEKAYYFDDEATLKAKELLKNPRLHALLSIARDSTPDDLQLAIDMLKRLKATNRDG